VVAAVLCFLVLLLNFFMTDLSAYFASSAAASFLFLAALVVLLAVVVRIMTKNTLLACAVALALEIVLFFFLLLMPDLLEGLVPAVLAQLSVFDRLEGFVNEVLDLRAIVFDLSVIGVFLFLSVQSLEKRRWS